MALGLPLPYTFHCGSYFGTYVKIDAMDSDLQGIKFDSWGDSTECPFFPIRTSPHYRWFCPTLLSILRHCWILRIAVETR